MESKNFDFEKFDIPLETEWIGRNFYYVDEMDSTNSFLLDSANNITQEGSLVLAEFQKKGKGRLEREWHSKKAQNLTFSMLLLNEKFIQKHINVVNLGSAVIVANAIENLFQIRTNLKWPNDILINNRKISGILLESSSSGNKINKLAIGIGINVNQTKFPDGFNIPPTSVKLETDNTADREKLLAEFLNLFEEMLGKIGNDHNAILRDWQLKCRMLGEKVTIKTFDSEIYGTAEDINDEGLLLLRKQNGKIEKISFGDVTVL